MFKLLDEECMIKGTDTKLLKKYNDILPTNKAFKRVNKFNSNGFIVCHYAGDVEYEITDFLDKNRDTISEIINETLRMSKTELISSLFKKEDS